MAKKGRPKKHNLDKDKVEQLASFGCTNGEISSFFGCSDTTLTRNYGENLTKGRDKGNVTMLIWLGKQVLGQVEKSEVKWENPVDGVEFIDV